MDHPYSFCAAFCHPTLFWRSGWYYWLADGRIPGVAAGKVDSRDKWALLGLVHPFLTGCDHFYRVIPGGFVIPNEGI